MLKWTSQFCATLIIIFTNVFKGLYFFYKLLLCTELHHFFLLQLYAVLVAVFIYVNLYLWWNRRVVYLIEGFYHVYAHVPQTNSNKFSHQKNKAEGLDCLRRNHAVDLGFLNRTHWNINWNTVSFFLCIYFFMRCLDFGIKWQHGNSLSINYEILNFDPSVWISTFSWCTSMMFYLVALSSVKDFTTNHMSYLLMIFVCLSVLIIGGGGLDSVRQYSTQHRLIWFAYHLNMPRTYSIGICD